MSAPNYIQVDCYIPLAVATAGTADTLYAAPVFAGEWLLKAACFTCFAAVTAHAVNYGTITLKKGATSIAAEATTVADTGDIAVTAAEPLVLTGTGQDLEFSQHEPVVIAITKAGTGVAIEGLISLGFEKMPG